MTYTGPFFVIKMGNGVGVGGGQSACVVCLRVVCACTRAANERGAVLMKRGWSCTLRKIHTASKVLGDFFLAVEMIHLDPLKNNCDSGSASASRSSRARGAGVAEELQQNPRKSVSSSAVVHGLVHFDKLKMSWFFFFFYV